MEPALKHTWNIFPTIPDHVTSRLGFPKPRAQLLYNRGIDTYDDATSFLSPNETDSHDPWLMPDMDAAVERLRRAIDEGEPIGVFGDFDIDGVSGTAVLTTALRNLGASVVPYIPNRASEGHGLTAETVSAMVSRGASVLVTVDCAFSTQDGADMAGSLGVDAVITDHHVVPDAPPYPFTALVNPHRPDSEYPFPHLTGVGAAYKLVQALYEATGREEPIELLELVALGTIGDVGPLLGENRYFVAEGIRRMNTHRSTGIAALADTAGFGERELDTDAMSFQIIPRLNAPGRLADAGISLELLTTTNRRRAQSLAETIDGLNVQRREQTAAGVELAERQILKRWEGSPPGVIMVGSATWGHGIVGLIAGRLAEKYGRPAIAVAVDGAESRGSARSVPKCNILEVIDDSARLLTRYGGHAQAAGFSIPTENLRALADTFELLPANRYGAGEPEFEIDLIADPSYVERELFEFAESLAPFGKSNPRPRFASSPLRVLDAFVVGAGGAHLKLRLQDGQDTWEAIAFRQGDRKPEAERGSEISIAYQMERNMWRGRTRTQLLVDDIAPAI